MRYRRVSSLSKESADLASMSCLQLSDPDYCTQLSSSRPSHPSVASRQNDWPFDLLSKSSFDKMTARDESSDKGKEKKKKQQVKEEMKGKKGGKPVRLSCPADKCYTVVVKYYFKTRITVIFLFYFFSFTKNISFRLCLLCAYRLTDVEFRFSVKLRRDVWLLYF